MSKKLKPEALRLITDNAISLLQEGIDEAPTHSIWPSDMFYDTQRCLQSKEDFQTSCKTLQRLKSFNQALMSVTSMLTDKIDNMQKKILPASRYHGLESLPDDIFMRILDMLAAESMVSDCATSDSTIYAYDPIPWWPIGFAETRGLTKTLMAVSRRFRECVVENVSFWKGLDQEFFQNEGLDIRLARSKNAPLALGLLFTDIPENVDILSKALLHKDRFEHMQIQLQSRPSDIKRFLPTLEFPSLVSLQLSTDNTPGYEEFFDEWKFPRLRKLECTSYTLPPAIFPGLTELTLSYGGNEHGQNVTFIRELIELLRSIDNLQSLSLDIAWIFTPMDVNEHITAVELPTIINFTICNFIADTSLLPNTSVLVLGQVLRALKMPNVETMTLSAYFSRDDIKSDSIGRLFGETHLYSNSLLYPSIKDLSLKFLGPDRYPSDPPQIGIPLDLCPIFAAFPNLFKLEIDAPDFKFGIWAQNFGCTSMTDPINMKNMALKGCQFQEYEYEYGITEILKYMRTCGAKLEDLVIWSKYNINLERIQKVCPTANIRMHPFNPHRYYYY